MKPFTSEWLTWGEENSQTLSHRTDTTDTGRAKDGSNQGTDITATRHKVLPHATLTKVDLKYTLDYVEGELPRLSPDCRERFNYWLDLIKSEGYPSEQAMRAAFYRTIKLPRREYR